MSVPRIVMNFFLWQINTKCSYKGGVAGRLKTPPWSEKQKHFVWRNIYIEIQIYDYGRKYSNLFFLAYCLQKNPRSDVKCSQTWFSLTKPKIQSKWFFWGKNWTKLNFFRGSLHSIFDSLNSFFGHILFFYFWLKKCYIW